MSAKRFTGKTESDAVMNAAMELGIQVQTSSIQ